MNNKNKQYFWEVTFELVFFFLFGFLAYHSAGHQNLRLTMVYTFISLMGLARIHNIFLRVEIKELAERLDKLEKPTPNRKPELS